jgi:hypothetical protein
MVAGGIFMTWHRWLTAGLLCSIVGCAAIPLGGDDIAICPDAACALPPADGGSFDGITTGFDASPEASAAQPRGGLCDDITCGPLDEATSCNSTTYGDAGAPTSDAGKQACRMITGGTATCEAAGTGLDGASCMSGTDCAPGFECVGDGTCRHYCCDDAECATLSSGSNQQPYFCDVGAEKSAPSVIVPVCFPVQQCKPLTNSCDSGQTCTIVEIDNGMQLVATCDAVGTGKQGDSCETEQCAEGFACLGTSGSRTCQQLCDATHLCGTGMTCNTQSLTGGLGVCSK